jgi:hypothetical protein
VAPQQPTPQDRFAAATAAHAAERARAESLSEAGDTWGAIEAGLAATSHFHDAVEAYTELVAEYVGLSGHGSPPSKPNLRLVKRGAAGD